MNKYTTISIPNIFIKQIEKAIEIGYFTTKADFVKQALRHELERQYLLDQKRTATP